MPNAFRTLSARLRLDSALWRQFMAACIQHGPEAYVKYAPAVFGLSISLALPIMRRRVRASLEHVLGPRHPTQEALEVAAVFANYAHCLTEAMLVGAERFVVTPHVIGAEHYDACVAEGRGIIIATAHTGGWDVAGSMLMRDRHQEVIAVMARERDSQARALQDEMRSRSGVKVVHIGESPFDALPLMQHLKKNAIVAMQIDRSLPNMRARTVPLLGKPWRVPEGPLRLAAATGAPILPLFTRRMGFMEYEMIMHRPLHLPRKPTPEQLDAAAQSLMNDLGLFLKTNPTQWFDFAREEPTTAAPP